MHLIEALILAAALVPILPSVLDTWRNRASRRDGR